MRVAVDTSVAVPLLLNSHDAHDRVILWAADHDLVLSGHAVFETYAVLTRLPSGLRVRPDHAKKLIHSWFRDIVVFSGTDQRTALDTLVQAGVYGGAVYDGLVGLAAKQASLPLATRDGRAAANYERLGVDHFLVL